MRPCGGICCQTCPREAPIRHCSGWGLPCHPCCHVCGGLLPRRFTIASDIRKRNTKAFSSLWRFPLGYPSRALPGTLASWSPDFPRMGRFPERLRPMRGHPAIRAKQPLRWRRATVNGQLGQVADQAHINCIQRPLGPRAKPKPDGL
jgi:hypothetical protein